MGLAPSATNITVRQVLEKLDGDFAATAKAVENGEFALWVGSGISRKAPSLGDLIMAAMEYFRAKAVDPATEAEYLPALDEALQLAGTDRAAIGVDIHSAFVTWSARVAIVDSLRNRYSRVLDIRVGAKPGDFVLWTVIDIRRQFENPPPPAAAHLCIALLVIEGAVKTIASGNWDGFIEAAVHRLGGGIPGILQVVVDPNQLRDPPGQARLLKFHGCIVHAEQDEARYRRFLTGSHTQIAMWPNNPDFAAMRNEVLGTAMNRKTMVLGLSIQDMNLQGVFATATATNRWLWPCAPNAPGHVFCEDQITQGQRDVLRIVYGDDYNGNVAAINAASQMRAWGEQVLIALVLKMIADKLNCLMGFALGDAGKAALLPPLTGSIDALRDQVAEGAIVDAVDQSRTLAVNKGIVLWSRLVAVFRGGRLQQDRGRHQLDRRVLRDGDAALRIRCLRDDAGGGRRRRGCRHRHGLRRDEHEQHRRSPPAATLPRVLEQRKACAFAPHVGQVARSRRSVGPPRGSNAMKMSSYVPLVLLLGAATPLAAKDKPARTYAVVNEDVGVPVFAYDITDRPYTVLGEVHAGVRKATVFSKEASQAKIYRELWERADKMGADAVVNAKYGDSHISLASWGKTNATGTAIKFTSAGQSSSGPSASILHP